MGGFVKDSDLDFEERLSERLLNQIVRCDFAFENCGQDSCFEFNRAVFDFGISLFAPSYVNESFHDLSGRRQAPAFELTVICLSVNSRQIEWNNYRG